jgi:glycine/D-amino acid oxidase-like deaminating enzyme
MVSERGRQRRGSVPPAHRLDRNRGSGHAGQVSAERPPRRCAVIGAGVLGVCVAARLAEAGLGVTLLERDRPGRAATGSSFAWLNANDKAPRAYHDLNHAGMRAWAGLAARLGGAAWYRPAGNIEWAQSAPGRAQLAARVRRLTEWGYPARLIDAAEAAGLEPSLRLPHPAPDVAWFPDEGYLLTEPLVSHMTEAAARHGATVLTGEPGRVVGLDAGEGGMGRRVAVRTAAGQVIPADVVVCCAGRWVPELAALAGAAGPVPLVGWAEPGATAPGLVVQAGPVTPPGPQRMVHAPGVYLRPHSGGLVHLEAPDAAVDLHTPEADLRRWAEELLRRARRVVRGLQDARVAGYRVCVRPMPADGRSIVGPLPGAGDLYVAVTHSGVTLAAHLSRLIADELVTGVAATELAPYRPGRFADDARPMKEA